MIPRFLHRTRLCWTILASIALAPAAFSQGDGPRAYFPAPVDTNLVALYGIFLDSNKTFDSGTVFSDGDLNLNMAAAQYTRTFAVGGNTSALFVVLPAGEVSGRISKGPFSPNTSSSGMGDMLIGGVLGLVGSPALDLQEYMTYKPEVSLGLLTKFGLPTGAYDSSDALNMGTNRWSAQVGLPWSFYWGETLTDAGLTTLDFLPSVTFYGDNGDPNGGNNLEQDMLFLLEMHLTHNINRAMWVSLDAFYTRGGETTMDGVAGDNAQESFSLGGSASVSLSSAFSLKFTYGGVVARNDDGPDGQAFRVVASLAF